MGADDGMAGLERFVEPSLAAASSPTWRDHPGSRTGRQRWPTEGECPPCCPTLPKHEKLRPNTKSQEADSRLLSPVGGADDVQVLLAARLHAIHLRQQLSHHTVHDTTCSRTQDLRPLHTRVHRGWGVQAWDVQGRNRCPGSVDGTPAAPLNTASEPTPSTVTCLCVRQLPTCSSACIMPELRPTWGSYTNCSPGARPHMGRSSSSIGAVS